jgi:hypothetical protein
MADTIIERDATTSGNDSSSGWAVAVIILIAVIVAGGLYFYYHRSAGAPQVAPAANINVTLPSSNGGTSGTGQ